RRPAQRGRRDPAVAPDPRYDQGQPVLGLRLQRRGDPAGGTGAAEPDARRGGHGLLERVRGRQQPAVALVPQPRPRRPAARRALTAPALAPSRRRPMTTAETSPTDSSATAGDVTEEHHHGYISDKARYLARLKRIEGQARGLHRMVDEEKYCIDILTQISALKRALDGVATGLLDDHLQHCVLDAARAGGEEGAAKLEEASAAIARLVRS